MSSVTIAAVQAASVLMDREATLDKAVELIAKAAADGARIVVFPEVFIPGTPVWVYNQPIWERDDAWYAMLLDQAVTVPGPSLTGSVPPPRMPAYTS
jgi:nitrilase